MKWYSSGQMKAKSPEGGKAMPKAADRASRGVELNGSTHRVCSGIVK